MSEFPFSDGSIQCISWGEDNQGLAGDQAQFEPSFKSRVFRMAVERVGVDQFLPLRPLNLIFGDEGRQTRRGAPGKRYSLRRLDASVLRTCNAIKPLGLSDGRRVQENSEAIGIGHCAQPLPCFQIRRRFHNPSERP